MTYSICNMDVCLKCLILSQFIGVTLSADTAAWKTRVIYQVLTDRFSPEGTTPDQPCTALRSWCGGTYQGILQRLDYIQQLGGDAIWISPMVLNTDGGYHGYWAKDIYGLEPHFGTESDLRQLIQACHDRDIFVMLDVVPNHMGYPPGCDWNPCEEEKLLNVSGLRPFNDLEHYHTLCYIEDYNNQTQVELCRLAQLPDLNQTVPFVRSTLLSWINDTTQQYDFDGYRIDTVRHIALDFWPEYQEAAGVFTVREVASENSDYVGPYQGPLTSVLNFPLYYALRRVFMQRTDTLLEFKADLDEQRQYFSDPTVLGIFVDNHDQPRFLNSSSDLALYRNSLAYILFAEGIPIVYYGCEQAFSGGYDPDNRESLWPHYDTDSELFQFLSRLLSFRHDNVADITSVRQAEIHVDEDCLAFTRGGASEVLVFISRVGHGQAISRTFGINALEGSEYVNVLDPEDRIAVIDGMVTIEIQDGEPRIYAKVTLEPSHGTTLFPNPGMVVVLLLLLLMHFISPYKHTIHWRIVDYAKGGPWTMCSHIPTGNGVMSNKAWLGMGRVCKSTKCIQCQLGVKEPDEPLEKISKFIGL